MCPNAWHGQFTRGDQKQPTIILEEVAAYYLWIWHAFFGSSGANNDINVLGQSQIFNNIYLGKSYDVPFVANETSHKRGHYLTDGIYLELTVFLKSFTCPNDEKRLKFKVAQESTREGIERTFGVLKRRWQILSVPAQSMECRRISSLMYACIILHNMILEDEERAIRHYNESENLPNVKRVGIGSEAYMVNKAEMYDRVRHHNFRADLVEHVFNVRREPIVDDFVKDNLFNDINEELEMFEGDGDEDFDDVSNEND
ncbi:uncharacterized protein LOC111899222 [Lactuca sativa]|uniref:uncharacterized protein LOC111899222 n=1 Tax=Lactuca sativa TaxID=4236 RepID=UPI000CD958E0|nr:uncharacterized protein LOC111899222 [Lactuca sativa]